MYVFELIDDGSFYHWRRKEEAAVRKFFSTGHLTEDHNGGSHLPKVGHHSVTPSLLRVFCFFYRLPSSPQIGCHPLRRRIAIDCIHKRAILSSPEKHHPLHPHPRGEDIRAKVAIVFYFITWHTCSLLGDAMCLFSYFPTSQTMRLISSWEESSLFGDVDCVIFDNVLSSKVKVALMVQKASISKQRVIEANLVREYMLY